MSIFRTWVVGQFGNPRGVWGKVAGSIMANRPSNRRRNLWTVDLLDLQPGQRVLEVGFGPGLALERAADQIGASGYVAGIDVSEVMLKQALRRNAALVEAGRMKLWVGSVEAMPDFDVPFDAILAINTIGFWPDAPARLRDLRERLAPGGRVAVTVQPRSKGATGETTDKIRVQLERDLLAAGFESIVAHWLDTVPPTVCVIGVRPQAEQRI
jgi:ubiquinone/menaquinone biosynthesis C-methylase UbiE